VGTLDALGIGTDAIDTVIISHWHGDHINGLSNEGMLTYPNAMVYFPQAESDFMESAPDDVVGGARAKLQPALDAEQVTFYNDGDEIVSGIQAIATPGHTPGHSSFLIESGGNQLIHFVDSVISAYVSFPHPDWHFGFDADPEQAVETRRTILERANSEQMQVMGYHFPFPGLGYAINDGDAWRFVPAAF
jgi:glyoxylase-like metal-dependent hydrolase (beta-lactamase superfamily II)